MDFVSSVSIFLAALGSTATERSFAGGLRGLTTPVVFALVLAR